VGDPCCSHREGVSTDKYKSEEVETAVRKSDRAYYQ
jgi:hypothetical protein